MNYREQKAAEYRRHAAQCLELAEQVSLHDHRDRLREMAREWLATAEKLEAKAI